MNNTDKTKHSINDLDPGMLEAIEHMLKAEKELSLFCEKINEVEYINIVEPDFGTLKKAYRLLGHPEENDDFEGEDETYVYDWMNHYWYDNVIQGDTSIREFMEWVFNEAH